MERIILGFCNHVLCLSSVRIVSTLTDYERYLETYSLEEILELNDFTEAEVLEYLVEQKFIQLPGIKPCDV